MGRTRLSDLAILNVECDFVDAVLKEDMEKMIDEFGRRMNRNSQFL